MTNTKSKSTRSRKPAKTAVPVRAPLNKASAHAVAAFVLLSDDEQERALTHISRFFASTGKARDLLRQRLLRFKRSLESARGLTAQN